MSKSVLFLCAAAVSAGAPLSAQAPAVPAAAEPAGDEAAISRTNVRWLELIKAGDAAGIASTIYAPDGAFMPPGAPIAIGTAAIQTGWEGILGLPEVSLTFETDVLGISQSGDLAYDRGTYKLTANPPSGAISDTGKYVVVWRKVDGQWRVVADIFNGNGP